MLCWILNIAILCIFGYEIWREYDILDYAIDRTAKIKCYVRIALASVVTEIALWILYLAFDVNSENLFDYIKTRRV